MDIIALFEARTDRAGCITPQFCLMAGESPTVKGIDCNAKALAYLLDIRNDTRTTANATAGALKDQLIGAAEQHRARCDEQ